MSSRGRAHALVVAVAIAAAHAAFGCGLLADDDAAAPPGSSTDALMPGCEATDGAPTDLRCTGLYTDIATKTLSPQVRAFVPAVPLWSDGAEKLRWVVLPDGAQIDTTSMDEWAYPVGTKAWKEFRVGGKRIETRFLQKVRADRWVSGAYVWSADETSATLQTEGATLDLGGGVSYLVPKSTACNECHKGRKDKLLGFEAISLGQPGASGLTLGVLAAEGRLTAPPAQTSVAMADDGTGHAAEALGWLHINCGTSCHTGTSLGIGYGTGLRLRIGWDELTTKPPAQWAMVTGAVGVAIKSPKWAGDIRVVPGDPGASVLLQLIGQRGAEQMPPIGTRVVDDKGRAAVEAWIGAMHAPAP
jgi:hypothetical protein